MNTLIKIMDTLKSAIKLFMMCVSVVGAIVGTFWLAGGFSI